MKKIAFLTCDDLSAFVVDDDYLFSALRTEWPDLEFEILSWSNPEINWSDFDLAVIRTTWDYTHRRDEFLEKLDFIEGSGCTVLNSPEIIRWNSHKSYLKDLNNSGVTVIESYFLSDETMDSLKNKLSSKIKYVLKPIVGASAEKIEVLTFDQLIQRISELEDKNQWFVQPFINEVVNGEISLFYFNSKFSHAAKKVPKKGDFRVQEEHGGLITSYEPESIDIEFGKHVLAAIPENLLYSRIDYLKTPKGPQLIELELVEPSLYFRTSQNAPSNFVLALKSLK